MSRSRFKIINWLLELRQATHLAVRLFLAALVIGIPFESLAAETGLTAHNHERHLEHMQSAHDMSQHHIAGHHIDEADNMLVDDSECCDTDEPCQHNKCSVSGFHIFGLLPSFARFDVRVASDRTYDHRFADQIARRPIINPPIL